MPVLRVIRKKRQKNPQTQKSFSNFAPKKLTAAGAELRKAEYSATLELSPMIFCPRAEPPGHRPGINRRIDRGPLAERRSGEAVKR